MARLSNRSWLRGSFGLESSRDQRNFSVKREKSDFKFSDTTFGGNEALNAPPQFTMSADPKVGGLFTNYDLDSLNEDMDEFNIVSGSSTRGSYQQGRFYSKTIDDEAQHIYVRFGLPKWTGAAAFYANMYDDELGYLTKTGEYGSALRSFGKYGALAAMFVILPAAVILPLIVTTQVMKWAMGKKPSRYYYLNPTPHLYLQAVQIMAEAQLLHAQLVPMLDPFNADRYTDVSEEGNRTNMTEIYSMLPEIWKSDGRFDIYKAIGRFQATANYQHATLEELYNKSATREEYERGLRNYMRNARQTNLLKKQASEQDLSLVNLARRYAENPAYQLNEADEKARSKAWSAVKTKYADGGTGESADNIIKEQNTAKVAELNNAKSATVDVDQTSETFWDGIINFTDSVEESFKSSLRDGTQWVCFAVNGTESISDSFSNTTKEPEIANLINGAGATARRIETSTSGGKTGFDTIDAVIKGVSDVMAGAISALQITGLKAIYNSSHVNMPEVYESSTSSVGSIPITFQLRSPYGDDFSRFQNITLPLLFWLAAVWPLAAGKQTSNAPFLCEMYCPGRQITRLGIIESITVTRGVGNRGWRGDGKMLGCDVTVNIKDLAPEINMPVIRDAKIFDDDNAYTDYMAMLGGATLNQLTYALEKVTLNTNKWLYSWKNAFNAGRIGSAMGDGATGRMLSAFARTASRG